MTDYDARRASVTYSNLLDQTYAAIILGTICLTAMETLSRIPRRRGNVDASQVSGLDGQRDMQYVSPAERDALQRRGSREAWITGYLYLGRCWAAIPSPPHPRIPLLWALQALKTTDQTYLELAGVDATVYLRFLRGCWFFAGLHTLTTMAILLPIHYTFDTAGLRRSDMNRGSITGLVASGDALTDRLLWIHMTLLFWITFTWMAVLVWVIRGTLRFRALFGQYSSNPIMPAAANGSSVVQAAVTHEKETSKPVQPVAQKPTPDFSLRCRTILMTNIPQHFRTEEEIAKYFTEYLPLVSPLWQEKTFAIPLTRWLAKFGGRRHSASEEAVAGPKPADGPNTGKLAAPSERVSSPVESVTLVRKLSALASLIAAREKDLEALETAHIALARNVLLACKRRIQNLEERRRKSERWQNRTLRWWEWEAIPGAGALPRSFGRDVKDGPKSDQDENLDRLVDLLKPFLEEAAWRDAHYSVMLKLLRWIQGVTGWRPASGPASSPQREQPRHAEYVWDALHGLDRDILLPYQPLARTRHASNLLLPFNLMIHLLWKALRKPRPWIEYVPTIDLLFIRLVMHTAKIEEERQRDEASVPSASSAFVLFRDWRDARKAVRGLPHYPWKPLTNVTQMAPQVTDLDWERLTKGKFTAQFLRDGLVGLAVWFFQIFWIIILQAVVGLISIDNLAAVFPRLGLFFDVHPQLQSLLTGLVPTLIVAILGVLIPVILFAIGRKAQTEVTYSGLHNGILIRYYKWLIINIVIFFCIGYASFNAFLKGFKTAIPDPFTLVASSFPAAAPFYASWFILQTSLQNLMQIGLFGLPLLTYIFGVRKSSTTPRKRYRGTRPRTIDYHYWLPNHLLAVIVVMIFAVLNPLVIPFAFIYFSVANVVFRNQFLHVYARRFYEGKGKMLTVRMLRYSLDGLALAQLVFLAFSLLLAHEQVKKTSDRARAGLSGTLFGMTFIVKIIATRAFKARYARLEDTEFARLCGQEDPPFASENAPLQFSLVGPLRKTNPMAALRRHKRRDPHHDGPDSVDSPTVTDVGDQFPAVSSDSPAANAPGEEGGHARAGGIAALVHKPVFQAPFKYAGRLLARQQKAAPADITHNFVGETKPTRVVTPHPPLHCWDDTPNSSMPYECPFYAQPLSDYLLLPRDPLGPVDLDDTVELRRVIMGSSPDESDEEEPRSSATDRVDVVDELLTTNMTVPVRRESRDSEERLPISQSPDHTSGASSPHRPSSLRTSSLSSWMEGQPVSNRRRASSTEVASRPGGMRQPSIAETLQLATSGRRLAPDIIPDMLAGDAGQHANVPGSDSITAAAILDVWPRAQPSGRRGGENASVMSGSVDGARGPLAQGGSRISRNAIEAHVRAEVEREEARRRQEQKEEAEEDVSAEEGETRGWTALRRLVVKRRTDD